MADFQWRFFEDFNDGTVPSSGWFLNPPTDAYHYVRNGSITEPVGSSLILSWLAGVSTKWDTGVSLAPIALKDVSGYRSLFSRTYYVEILLNSFTGGNYQEGGMAAYDGSLDLIGSGNNGFIFGWNNRDNKITVRQDQYVLGVQTHTLLAASGAIAWPGTIYFRIYHNPYKNGYPNLNVSTTLDDVDGYVLQPGWQAYYYKTSPGGSWTRLYAHNTLALPFGYNPWWLGPYAGNGYGDASTPVGTWGFDYLSIYSEPSVVPAPVPSENSGTLRIETSSVEEKLAVSIPQFTSASTGSQVNPVSELKPVAAAEEVVRVIQPSVLNNAPTNRFPLNQLHSRAAPSETIAIAPEMAASVEEFVRIVAGQTPTYHTSNSDVEGHPYLIGTQVLHQTYYDATQDVWHIPTANFNGFGRDGYLYISGVQQVTRAAWSTETASADRSSRGDFPLRSMICTTRNEVVIFDLDNWPTSIKVWMRFRLGADVSNYYMIGRGENTVRKAVMKNGLLAVALQNTSWEVGGLVLIDFKTQGQYAGNLIRSDNHWRLISGKTIANRNSTGLWETFSSGHRLASNYVQWVDIFNLWSYWDSNQHYIVTGGEDGIEIIYYYNRTSAAQVDGVSGGPGRYRGTLDPGSNNYLYTPPVVFDEDGWLWWGSGPRVYRSVMDHQWCGTFIQGESASLNYDPKITPPYADLTHYLQSETNPNSGVGNQVVVFCLQQLGRYIFAGTSVGVFRIDRVTMEWTFCYSIAGYGGGGRLNVPPAGEIIAGEQPVVLRMHSFRTTESDYLVIATNQGMRTALSYVPAKGKGSVTIIRLYDDYPIQHINPALYEDGAWGVNGVLY